MTRRSTRQYRLLILVAIIAAAVSAAGCSVHRAASRSTPSSTVPAAPGPTTVKQLCDAQTWPRALPNVVGRLLYQAKRGALGCYDDVKAVAPDGHDPLNHPARPAEKTYRIAAMSPAVGTPIGRHDTVTVELAEVDATQPAVFQPCGWVTAAEAADILSGPVTAEPIGDQPGSVDVACLYDKPVEVGEGVQIDLQMPGAFAVDAGSEFALATSAPRTTGVDGIGVKAACVNEPTTTPPSTTLVVLLNGDRLLRVTQGYASCNTLKRFVQLAIGRIGA
jgi:hypothetical protein